MIRHQTLLQFLLKRSYGRTSRRNRSDQRQCNGSIFLNRVLPTNIGITCYLDRQDIPWLQRVFQCGRNLCSWIGSMKTPENEKANA